MMFEIIEIIFLIILACGMGYCLGLFSYFLDYCFWPGSIFQGYIPALAKRLVKIFKKEKYNEIMMLKKEQRPENFIDEAEDIFFFKMLGRCPNCFNIWVGLLAWAIICPLTFFNWFYIFPFLLFGNKTIRELTGSVYDTKPIIKRLRIYSIFSFGKKF